MGNWGDRQMKKNSAILISLASLIILLTASLLAYADDNMSTAAEWAIDEIVLAKEQNLANCDIFESDFSGNATRGEFANFAISILQALEQKVDVSAHSRPYQDRFSDVPADDINIGLAYSYYIINGVSEDYFDIYGAITREQLCTMLYRIKERVLFERSQGDVVATFERDYDDIAQISDWALDAVKYMNSEGIIKGRGNSLDPKGAVTRQEAILMGYRLYMTLLSHQLSIGINQARPITDDIAYRYMAIARTFAENQQTFGDDAERIWQGLKTYVNLIGDSFYRLQDDGNGAYYVLDYDQMAALANAMFYDDDRQIDEAFLLSYRAEDDIFYQKIDKAYYFYIEKQDNVKTHCQIVGNIRAENYKTIGFLVNYLDGANSSNCKVYFTERSEHNSFDQFYYQVTDFTRE